MPSPSASSCPGRHFSFFRPACRAPACSVPLQFSLDLFFLLFLLFSQAFPTLKLFHEDKLQTPDYAGDRTVDAFSKYLYNKADRVVSEIRAKGQREGRIACLLC